MLFPAALTRFCPVCRWDVAAITDFHSEYSDSCGICFEVACDDTWIHDNYGLKLDRTYSCYNTGQVRGQPQAPTSRQCTHHGRRQCSHPVVPHACQSFHRHSPAAMCCDVLPGLQSVVVRITDTCPCE